MLRLPGTGSHPNLGMRGKVFLQAGWGRLAAILLLQHTCAVRQWGWGCRLSFRRTASCMRGWDGGHAPSAQRAAYVTAWIYSLLWDTAESIRLCLSTGREELFKSDTMGNMPTSSSLSGRQSSSPRSVYKFYLLVKNLLWFVLPHWWHPSRNTLFGWLSSL